MPMLLAMTCSMQADFLRSADGRLATRNSQGNQTLREVFAAAPTAKSGIGANGHRFAIDRT